jgi:hypothetical protein
MANYTHSKVEKVLAVRDVKVDTFQLRAQLDF